MIRENGDISKANGAAVYEAQPVEQVEPATPATPDPPPPEGKTRAQEVGGVVLQLVIAVVVVAAGLGLTYLLVSTKTAPAKIAAGRAAPVVLTEIVRNGPAETIVEGFGTVRAANELRVVPQVGGRVTRVDPQFIAGGTLPAGAVVMEIEPADYEIAVERAEAQLSRVEARRRAAAAEVARRETALETMRAEAGVARAEFERVRPGEDVPPLVAREPQVRETEAALEAARAQADDVEAEERELEAALRQARLELDRTKVRLPDGPASSYRVAEEQVDAGQSVAAGQAVGTVYAADSLEVPVPLSGDQLAFVVLPGDGEDEPSTATITADYGGREREWPGRVDRTEGRVNPRTRLVEVVVAVGDADAAGGTRLVPGSFVNVAINGRRIEGVARLPRRAVHVGEDGRTAAHVAEPDGEEAVLRVVPVEVVRRSGDDFYVRGLPDGAAAILSNLDVASDGMAVQIAE